MITLEIIDIIKNKKKLLSKQIAEKIIQTAKNEIVNSLSNLNDCQITIKEKDIMKEFEKDILDLYEMTNGVYDYDTIEEFLDDILEDVFNIICIDNRVIDLVYDDGFDIVLGTDYLKEV